MNHIEQAQRIFAIEIAELQNAQNCLDKSFNQVVDLMFKQVPPGKVVVTGIGKSGHIGCKIAATLASTGTPAFFVHPAEAGHGDLGMINSNDVVIALSQSGKSEELLRILPYFKRNHIPLIAMTGDRLSPLAKSALWVLSTKVRQEACPLGLAPTSSTTLALVLGDALALCLLKARGFTQADFAITHPHGTLGRKLLIKVSDVMSIEEFIPIIPYNVFIKEALFYISKCGMGFGIVMQGQTVEGVFTDGDLRRCLDNDLDLNKVKINVVMNTTYTSINESQLAVEAADLMERRKISALPVFNRENQLVGAVNMRQLLQAGVV